MRPRQPAEVWRDGRDTIRRFVHLVNCWSIDCTQCSNRSAAKFLDRATVAGSTSRDIGTRRSQIFFFNYLSISLPWSQIALAWAVIIIVIFAVAVTAAAIVFVARLRRPNSASLATPLDCWPTPADAVALPAGRTQQVDRCSLVREQRQTSRGFRLTVRLMTVK